MSDHEDRIQRALNETKKKELEERFGGMFSPQDSSLPPNIEAEWLMNIEEFEAQFEHVGVTTVRHFIGDPAITPIAAVPEDRLSCELGRIMDLLERRGVVVHFCAPVSDEDAYRFISEELLDEEIDDIVTEGMTHNFVYEEYHPNDALDAAFHAEVFLRALFSSKPEILMNVVAPDGTSAGAGHAVSRDRILHDLQAFSRDIASFIDFDVTIAECTVEDNHASIEACLEWDALKKVTMNQVSGCAGVHMELQKVRSEMWPITAVTIQDTPFGSS